MNKIKQILRCYAHGMGLKSISSVLCVSRNTVRRYVRTYQESGVPMEQFLSMREEHLRDMFSGRKERVGTPTPKEVVLQELLPEYAKLLCRKNQTRAKLYQEYHRQHPDGYSYSGFCIHLRRYLVQNKPVGHVEHKAADQMYVDFAGDKLSITDPTNGQSIPVEVFVSILPCSHYTFCKAVATQRKEDFIGACEDALRFYGGAPMVIVPDNLKSAVNRPDKVEPIINQDFAAFAEHYGCVVMPARVRRPRDKALVENAVKLIYRHIYPSLRSSTFHNLKDLNTAMALLLDEYNSTKMSSRSYSRRSLFEEVERDYLRPLPANRFIMKERKTVTVVNNSYVTLKRHHYSVPIKYVGKSVELVYDADLIEIYHGLQWIATHRRDDTPYAYSQKKSHNLPCRHGGYEQDMDQIYERARAIDNTLLLYLQKVAAEKVYPAVAFRSCRGILALENKYGLERLETACHMADVVNSYSYNHIADILRTGQDLSFVSYTDTEQPTVPKAHKNLRGRDYFITTLKDKKHED